MDDELESTAAALAASSATQRKWASVVLLGPLMPSLMATVIIVVGGAIVKASGGMVDIRTVHITEGGATFHVLRAELVHYVRRRDCTVGYFFFGGVIPVLAWT